MNAGADPGIRQVVLASGNQGKLRELRAALHPLGWQVDSASDFNLVSPAETGTTFVENAIIKARHAAQATGLPALADDSGLTVAALGGAPGVYSARFAGEGATDQENLDHLLSELTGVPCAERQACFVSVVVFMRSASDPLPLVATGLWHGHIALAPIGEHGFGYDPVFFVPQLGRSAAQLELQEKNAFSHRGKAIRALIAALNDA